MTSGRVVPDGGPRIGRVRAGPAHPDVRGCG
jgi:hypothetical protein